MRARLLQNAVTLEPGRPATVAVEVTNDLEVIDGIRVGLDAPSGLEWRVTPEALPLFPDDQGRLSLTLSASPTFAAGDYEIPVVATSSVGAPELRLPVTVTVTPAPQAALAVTPLVRNGRHRVRYDLRVDNTGNTPLELALVASDPNRQAPVRFAQPNISVAPGASATTAMTATAKRHFFSGDVSYQLTVLGTAGELQAETRAVFRQGPVIPRGLRTALVLALIVALWAGIFATLLNRALANDPLTKNVPASFYASVASANHAKLASLGGGRAPVGLTAASGAVPAGAVPKSGLVIGVGGTISGTVTAESTGSGIGRISVEVYRVGGTGAPVASAATAANGTYSVPGLLPGAYDVLFEAQGYQSVWYPSASAQGGAHPINVQALATTANIDAVVAGLPGTITGLVDTGVHPSPPVSVTVQSEQGTSSTPIPVVKTNAAGAYTIANLPTPGKYDLSFSSPSYQLQGAVDQLSGGESLIANTVTLSAANGSISGTVIAGTAPLGGVQITAEANGQTFTTATPTTGPIGEFSLTGLPTPATYLLTFTKAGYGARIIGEALGPGQNLQNRRVKLAGGAGTVTGTVRSLTGQAIGGATVTVDGANPAMQTQTLTAGTVGAYSLSGLATPATYTLTFSAPSYESRTIAVALGSSAARTGVDVKLRPALATITGRVEGASGPLSGVSISATNGTTTTTTTSTSLPAGGFLLAGLAPGDYAVTFSAAGLTSATELVVIGPGQTRHLTVKLGS